jgi:hypothetical protein
MSHGAQCMFCKHAQWRRNCVIGCQAFEELNLPVRAIAALSWLTYKAARSSQCQMHERLEAGPDAYFAKDA